jgi:hypothetical protein
MLLAALAASSSVAAAQVPAKPVPPSPPPTPPPLLDQVEKVVTGPQFASSYGGDVLLSDGTITVYVTPAGLSNMQTALERTLGNASDMVSLRPVAHSFADLENLTSQIAADQASLAPSGITLSTWGPDPTSNTVRVAVLTDPSAADRVLGARYGSGRISVVQVPPSDTLIGLSNRYYDNAPFWDGDRVFINNDTNTKCTAGFAFRGNNSGNIFNTTAGHCGGSSVWTNLSAHYEMGAISTHYYTQGGDDFESFPCNCGALVWYEGPGIGTGQGSTHTVIGWCACNSGLVTMDGATTGEVPDFTVTQAGGCATYSVPGGSKTTCGINEATRSVTGCQPGDSGGPVYQRAPNNTVYATGTVVAGNSNGTLCVYQRWDQMQSDMNGSILTG